MNVFIFLLRPNIHFSLKNKRNRTLKLFCFCGNDSTMQPLDCFGKIIVTKMANFDFCLFHFSSSFSEVRFNIASSSVNTSNSHSSASLRLTLCYPLSLSLSLSLSLTSSNKHTHAFSRALTLPQSLSISPIFISLHLPSITVYDFLSFFLSLFLPLSLS